MSVKQLRSAPLLFEALDVAGTGRLGGGLGVVIAGWAVLRARAKAKFIMLLVPSSRCHHAACWHDETPAQNE